MANNKKYRQSSVNYTKNRLNLLIGNRLSAVFLGLHGESFR